MRQLGSRQRSASGRPRLTGAARPRLAGTPDRRRPDSRSSSMLAQRPFHSDEGTDWRLLRTSTPSHSLRASSRPQPPSAGSLGSPYPANLSLIPPPVSLTSQTISSGLVQSLTSPPSSP